MRKNDLKSLVLDLRSAIRNEALNKSFLVKAIENLAELNQEYNYVSFPELKNTEGFSVTVGESPTNIAEALLWKLGKWKAYKNFCEMYASEEGGIKNSNVVFYAFAQHLKDKENPIYDQHAIRAIWAICELSDEEVSICKSVLMDGSNKWRATGSGKDSINCYEIFLKHIRILKDMGTSFEELDKLLMPLGQIIKKETRGSGYLGFIELCGLTK